MNDLLFRIALSQPLVSIPPYRGDLLEYLQEREESLNDKTASIIDFPKPTLLPELWDFKNNVPYIKGEIRRKILKDLSNAIHKVEFKGESDWVKDICVVGSMTTNLYSNESDIDINVQIDYNLFRQHNPDFYIQDNYELRNFIRDKLYPILNIAFFPKRKIKYFIIGLDFLLEADYYYDLINNRWKDEKIPELIDLSYNPNKVFYRERAIACKAVKCYNALIERILTLLQDIGRVDEYLQNYESIYLKNIKTILSNEIVRRFKRLRELDRQILKFREHSYTSGNKLNFSGKELSLNWESHNVISKFIDLFGYKDLFEVLESRTPENFKYLYEYYRDISRE